MAGCVGARDDQRSLARIETTASTPPSTATATRSSRKNTLFFAISQSGETADTIMAMREVQRKGGKVLGIVNRVASTIARETGAGIYIHAGFEYAVASTKTMLNTMMALFLFALLLGPHARPLAHARQAAHRGGGARCRRRSAGCSSMRGRIPRGGRALRQSSENFYYIGRGYSYPVALEGALKLKEIAYVHAEGYSAAEMKHGPIALIDERFASVFVIPRDPVFSRDLRQPAGGARAQGPGAVDHHGAAPAIWSDYSDQVLVLPETDEILTPFLTTVAVQLFAYEFAVLRGCPIDQPKNLAKSVTVE